MIGSIAVYWLLRVKKFKLYLDIYSKLWAGELWWFWFWYLLMDVCSWLLPEREGIRDSVGISELPLIQLILTSCFRVSLEILSLSLEQMSNVRTLVPLLSRRRRKTIKTNFPWSYLNMLVAKTYTLRQSFCYIFGLTYIFLDLSGLQEFKEWQSVSICPFIRSLSALSPFSKLSKLTL